MKHQRSESLRKLQRLQKGLPEEEEDLGQIFTIQKCSAPDAGEWYFSHEQSVALLSAITVRCVYFSDTRVLLSQFQKVRNKLASVHDCSWEGSTGIVTGFLAQHSDTCLAE